MSVASFIERQVFQIQRGGYSVLFRKMYLAMQMCLRLPMYLPAIPAVVVIRLVKPWLLVRFGGMISSRIGHFAANTELYLCERDAGINLPKQRYIDIFYCAFKPICNRQLMKMWNRVLHIWPAWILIPIAHVNRLFPGMEVHEIGHNTQNDRDVHNLLDCFSSHVQFTVEEEARGETGLREMGIFPGEPFICLTVRDSAYLDSHLKDCDFNYLNYRDSDVQNYVLASEELAERGYYVIRMGAKVNAAMKTTHPKIIDYATNGMRSDFMDIYLGAKCYFCISVGTGFDAVPVIFRRPVAYVNMVPLGYLFTFINHYIGITKHHFSVRLNRELTLKEIFEHGVGLSLYTSEYESAGISLIENTPEEIRDLAIEMVERLNSTWHSIEDDETLQKRFWEIFPIDAVDVFRERPLHGEIRVRFGAVFLRNNRFWLQ